MRPVSKTKRDNVLSLIDHNMTTRPTAERVGVSSSTVSRIRHKFRPALAVAKGGRPKKLSVENLHFCQHMHATGECKTASEIAQRLKEDDNLSVSAATIQRALHQVGIEIPRGEGKSRHHEVDEHVGVALEQALHQQPAARSRRVHA